jgi:hypothetical protein
VLSGICYITRIDHIGDMPLTQSIRNIITALADFLQNPGTDSMFLQESGRA